MYRGIDTKTILEDLEAGAEYEIRVMPVRCTSNGDLCGAFSPASTFSLPAVSMPEPVVRVVPQQVRKDNYKILLIQPTLKLSHYIQTTFF